MSPQLPPAKSEIDLMPDFTGLPMECIHLVTNQREAEDAADALMAAGIAGFDTESKPTFQRGEKSTGPHLVQFAMPDRVYLFQTHVTDAHPALVALLESPKVIKVGFGLKGDLSQIRSRFGVNPGGLLDLDRSFRTLGYRTPLGTRSAVAILFQRHLRKSKSVTTSDWSSPHLGDRQKLYAANDAFAALEVYRALEAAGAKP